MLVVTTKSRPAYRENKFSIENELVDVELVLKHAKTSFIDMF